MKNITEIAAVATRLSKMTPEDHLFTSELAQELRADEPVRTEPAKPETVRRPSQKFTHWSEEDTLVLMQFDEDSQRMTDSERKREYRRLVRLFGRSASAVKNKLWKIRHGEQ